MPQAQPKSDTATYIKLVGTMFLWGGTWVAGRVIAQEVPAPLMVAAVRFFISAAILVGFAHLVEGRIPRPVTGREWGCVTGLAFSGIFLYTVCFFYGLRYIPAGRGALVVALNPVLVALAAWFIGQENMTPRKFAGVGIALIGCLLVVGNGDPMALLHGAIGPGEYLIVGCVLSWVIYTFLGRSATETLSPLAMILWSSWLGGLMLLVPALAQGLVDITDWSWRVWASIMFLAIFGTALGSTWFADAVKQMGAARASAFINLIPVFAVLQSAVLLDEQLALAVLLGGGLILVGVWLTTGMHGRTVTSSEKTQ